MNKKMINGWRKINDFFNPNKQKMKKKIEFKQRIWEFFKFDKKKAILTLIFLVLFLVLKLAESHCGEYDSGGIIGKMKDIPETKCYGLGSKLTILYLGLLAFPLIVVTALDIVILPMISMELPDLVGWMILILLIICQFFFFSCFMIVFLRKLHFFKILLVKLENENKKITE